MARPPILSYTRRYLIFNLVCDLRPKTLFFFFSFLRPKAFLFFYFFVFARRLLFFLSSPADFYFLSSPVGFFISFYLLVSCVFTRRYFLFFFDIYVLCSS
ncbi:hypothetical protein BC629DRAFT_1493726 [Irpex lacteus]|nr:hypothetical protein BC629DRAFT_1493726 [Irpex lacteus]